MDEEMQSLKNNNFKNYNNKPLNLSFEDVCYKVTCKRKKSEKHILKNVTGCFKSGRLTGILGPSGAGKTSLLNILAGFRETGVTGNIMINGRKRDNDKFRWQSCCIAQNTAMIPLLTAHETMMTAADLKLPDKFPIQKKENIVSEIADILNIQKIMNTRVDSISGGELKRLSIGIELVSNPPVMFFDEPTSGLDSVSSCQVVSHLRSLARGGRTIVCIIHQPSSKIFDMFDDIFLMTSGRALFSGPVRDIIPVFESAGFICPQYYNRADFVLEVASREIVGDIESLVAKHNTSRELHLSINNPLDENSSFDVPISPDEITNSNCRERNHEVDKKLTTSISIDEDRINYRKTYAVSQWKQFVILLKRSSTCSYRDILLTRMRIAVHCIVGIILGLIYLKIGNEASKITTNTAFLFFILMFLFFGNSVSSIIKFPIEKAVFEREHLNNWYSLPAYFFSKMLADIPLQILCPSLFLAISYCMTGQPLDFHRMALLWAVCVVFTVISQLCGLVSGVVFSVELGLFLMPSLTIPMVLFSGFFIRYEEIPYYFSFMPYISYFGYAFHAIMQSVYAYDRPDLHCSEAFCFFKKSSKFLDEIDMRKGSYGTDISCLVAFMVFMQISLYAGLKYRVWKTR